MTKPEWRDWVATGALLLSLINLWLLVFRKRPFLYVEPFPEKHKTDNRQLRLRIVNPSDLPFQISGLWMCGRHLRGIHIVELGADDIMYISSAGMRKWTAYYNHRIFRDFFSAQETKYYDLSGLPARHYGVLSFWWHRNGFLRIRLPMFLVISGKRLATSKMNYRIERY